MNKDWRSQFLEWLKEICPGDSPELYVLYDEGKYPRKHKDFDDVDSSPPTEIRAKIFTHDYVYSIVAQQRETRVPYLGCMVGCRTPRAGEAWTRGNDLPDGEFSKETWGKIKNAIIAHELVRIAKKTRTEDVWKNMMTKYGRSDGTKIFCEWEQNGDDLRNVKRYHITPIEEDKK